MKNSSSPDSSNSTPAPDGGFSPWQRLKTKRISYLTLPLLIMATITEFIILATGWRYQQVVCLPQGMGVTFFGIGPIGATILAVELLKLPLAVWTASRFGWQKYFMILCGLPLICVLTFQLVKDMAVYEMGVAMTPANQLLTKASDEEIKISQLSGELAAIEAKKTDREHKLADLAAKQAKAKADLDDSIKRNEEIRHDAISLTDYQRTQLNEVDARETAIIQQFNADTDQLNKALADLRARRETELTRDTKWNAEEARIENDYKAKLSDYQNKKAAYDKARADYDGANILKRQLMKEPVSPGVPPVREANTILKSTLVADLEAQIKGKEAELANVNARRRDRVAQVENDAEKLKSEFDQRSGTKREEADKQRQALLAAQTALATEWKAEQKQIDDELTVAVQKVDGIRTELNAAKKQAEGYYEAREAAIRVTQVHRIATTVEIIRGLIKGERPMSIKATAKERGDILTDQISMVRVWVYPVLAFIVAFLPTLMVEIGFSTVFQPEQQRAQHRLGFLGRRLYWVCERAGRQRILRAERIAKEAMAQIATRDKAVAVARAAAADAMSEKEAGLQSAHEAISITTAEHHAQLNRKDEDHAALLKQKEEEWVAKLGGMAESLNRAVAEKNALQDLQKAEIDRQVQARQSTWSDRLTQMRQELDEHRAGSETERTALTQAHHKRLLEVTDDCKTQVAQARRQAADAELAATAASAKLRQDVKDAVQAREAAESELKRQTEMLSVNLTQTKDEAAREQEKAARQEKLRIERQQAEFAVTLKQREEDFERRLKQREQELSLAYDARLIEDQTKIEQGNRRREAELQRQLETRTLEAETRWKQEIQQREDAAQARLKQREQQLLAQADGRLSETQMQAEQEWRRREAELERQLDAAARETNSRLKQELQQKELAFEARLKQREQEIAVRYEARETEMHNQWNADLRTHEAEWERQAELRARAAETRSVHELQQKEELYNSKARQRDQQWQVKLDTLRAELAGQSEEAVRRRGMEADSALRELEARLRQEMAQKEEAAQAKAKQREQEIALEITAQMEARRLAAQAQWESETEFRMRSALEPVRQGLVKAEKERDEAKQFATEHFNRVQHLEKKLSEASSFLNGWRNGSGNGKTIVGTE